MIELMTNIPIAPERTPASRPAGAGELPAGGESGPGFGEALEAALEPETEAAQAAAAALAQLPAAPVAGELPKGELSESGERLTGKEADPAPVAGKGVSAGAVSAQSRLPSGAAPVGPRANAVSPNDGDANGTKLASVLRQGDAKVREQAGSLEERASGRLESMLSGAKPWDSGWIREGMPRPEAGTRAESEPALETQPNPLSMMDLQAQTLGTRTPPAQAAHAALGAASMLPEDPSGGPDTGARVESLKVFPSETQGAERTAVEPAAVKAAPKVFGGSEFLNTLNTVKGGEPAAAESAAQASSASPVVAAGAVAGDRLASRGSLEEIGASPIRRERETGKVHSAGAGFGSQPQAASSSGSPVEVSGQVVQGTMARDRLATASVANLSAGIRDLKGQGGGEVRLRLNPEHLGELQLHVTTRGDQVSVKVHASSEHAREVLEESLSALKESLAGHKLTLGKIEIVSGGQQAADSGMGGFGQQTGSQLAGDFGGHRNPGSFQDMGGDGGRGHGREARDETVPGMTTAIPSARRMAAAAGASRGSGRLDVMA